MLTVATVIAPLIRQPVGDGAASGHQLLINHNPSVVWMMGVDVHAFFLLGSEPECSSVGIAGVYRAPAIV